MVKQSQPLVSICIPAYNSREFIGQAIESVLAQTYQNFELIIIDDCSTDKSLEVIRRYNDPRMVVIKNETNIGAEANWNKLLSVTRGKYIKILCGDDYLYPSCIEKQLSVFQNNADGNIALVCCKRDIIDKQGKLIVSRGFKNKSGRLPGYRAIKKTIRAGTNLIGEPTAVLFKAEILTDTGLFDGSAPYVLDLDMWCRMLLRGDVFIIPEPLCVFRVSPVSWSIRLSYLQSFCFKALIVKLAKDPRYRLSPLDKTLGSIMASANATLRLLFYKLVLSK